MPVISKHEFGVPQSNDRPKWNPPSLKQPMPPAKVAFPHNHRLESQSQLLTPNLSLGRMSPAQLILKGA